MISLRDIELKPEVRAADFYDLDIRLMIVFLELWRYAKYENLPVLVTSMIDFANGRKSKTHEEGRAIDISTKNPKWTEFHIERVVYKLNNRFKEYGTSPNSKIPPRVCVHHNTGNGYHFHLQVRRFADE